MPTIYLGFPIDNASISARNTVQRVRQFLRASTSHETNRVLYDPGAAFQTGQGCTATPYIKVINDTALDTSDGMFAILPAGARTWGLPAEIERARMLGKPVVILTDAEPSWSQVYDPDEVSWINVGDEDWCAVARHAMDHLVAMIGDKPPGHIDEDSEDLFAALFGDPYPGGVPEHQGTPHGDHLSKMYPPDDGVAPPATSEGDGVPEEGVPGFEPLPVARLNPALPALTPTRAYNDDAGLDLYVVGDHVIEPGTFKDIPSNIAVELPDWSWGFLVGRSSTLRKKHLMVNPGIIDRGYRGELYSAVWNLSNEAVHVKEGERIAQLIILDNGTRRLVPVPRDTLGEHPRGTSGFGSSGV